MYFSITFKYCAHFIPLVLKRMLSQISKAFSDPSPSAVVTEQASHSYPLVSVPWSYYSFQVLQASAFISYYPIAFGEDTEEDLNSPTRNVIHSVRDHCLAIKTVKLRK